VFVVIGWDNYFGFGFTTLVWKALYTKSVDSVFRTLWLATQTRNRICYSPPSIVVDFMWEFSLVAQEKGIIWFCMVLFLFKYFTKWNVVFVLNSHLRHSWDQKGELTVVKQFPLTWKWPPWVLIWILFDYLCSLNCCTPTPQGTYR